MSRELEENLKLRATLEYQNAVSLMALIAPKYPVKEIQVETFPVRYDFISTLIEHSLNRSYLAEGQSEEYGLFTIEANKVWQKWGVLDLMKEKLEMEWLKKELLVRYETLIGEKGQDLLWAITGQQNADNLMTAMAQLSKV